LKSYSYGQLQLTGQIEVTTILEYQHADTWCQSELMPQVDGPYVQQHDGGSEQLPKDNNGNSAPEYYNKAPQRFISYTVQTQQFNFGSLH
jgi:hypothetical protein